MENYSTQEITKALGRYGLIDFPVSDELKPLLVELSQMDDFLDSVLAETAKIDKRIKVFRKQMDDVATCIYQNRSMFKSVSRNHGNTIGTLTALAISGIGGFVGWWKEQERKQIEEEKHAELMINRRNLAIAKRENILYLETLLDNRLPKQELLYNKELSQAYNLSDDLLDRKLDTFKLVFFMFVKLKYMIELCDYFNKCFSFWIDNQDYKEIPPLLDKTFKKVSSQWIFPKLLYDFFDSDSVDRKWPVTLLLTLSDPYLLMINVGVRFSYYIKDGLLSDDGGFYSENRSYTRLSMSQQAYEFLQRNYYYSKTQELAKIQPYRKKHFGILDFLYFVFLLLVCMVITSILEDAGSWLWILGQLFFYIMAKFLPNVSSYFPYLKASYEYCEQTEIYETSIDELNNTNIFTLKRNE